MAWLLCRVDLRGLVHTRRRCRIASSKGLRTLDAPLTTAIVDALERLESGAIDAGHQILFIREVGARDNDGPVAVSVSPSLRWRQSGCRSQSLSSGVL